MALLQNGCFCCQLRTFVLVQAWLSTLLAVLQTIGGLLLLAMTTGLLPELDAYLVRSRPAKTPGGGRAAASAWKMAMVGIGLQGSILLLNGCVNLAVNVALILGCKKENRRLLLPALIWGAFAILFTIVLTVLLLITEKARTAAMIGAVAVPTIGLGVYVWLHILSYFLELRDEDREHKRQSL